MIRFMLRLVGALLVEEICERIRPAQWELAPLGKPDGWLRYYGPAVTGVKGPTQFSRPLPQGDLPVQMLPRTVSSTEVARAIAGVSQLSWTPSRPDPTTVRFTAKDE